MVSAKLKQIRKTLLNHRGVFYFFLIVLVSVALYLTFRDSDSRIVTEDVLKSTTEIQQTLDVNRPNAEALRTEVVKVKKPIYITKVKADTQKEALKKTQELYDNKQMPSYVYKEPDRTVIATKDDYEVGVYQVNLYRNWEIGTGIGVHDKDFYIPLSIKRNYDRSHSVEAEIHYDPNETKIDGYELKYNIHF